LPKKVKYWAAPVLLLAAVTLLPQTGVFSADKEKAPAAASTVTVATASVQYVDKTPQIKLYGSIEGKTSAAVSAKIAGRIQQILVEDGQAVSAGQPLIILESAELANAARMAQDSVTKARANYDNALANYNRYLTLFNQNAVSRQQLDSAETQLKIAQADLSSAQASLANAQQQYGYATITAPVDGVVANKTATVGQVVSPGVQLLTVEHLEQVYAVVNVEQQDMGVLQPGIPASVTVDAYPDQVFNGQVAIVNPVAGTGNRMFRTKIAIDNSDGRLKPGMFVKVQLLTGEPTPVLAVPQAALLQQQGLYYVYVVDNGQTLRQQVQIGEPIGDMMEITAGLTSGQTVAVSNVNNLKDGMAVQVAQ